jgi:YhcH/YjgK/YiaL family protein
MILDHLSNSAMYHTIHPGFKQAFDFLLKADLESLETGRYEIDGQKLFAMVQKYNTKRKEETFWEAHQRYIDVQYIFKGVEIFGYANVTHLSRGAYDPTRDFLPLHGEGDFLSLHEGYFVIFMPQDAHMPGIAVDSPSVVKKIVIKIAFDWDGNSPSKI